MLEEGAGGIADFRLKAYDLGVTFDEVAADKAAAFQDAITDASGAIDGLKYSLVENRVDPRAVAAGKPLKEIDLPHECVLTAIIRGGELIIPRGETVLQPDDEVLALVHISQLERLASLLRGP
jgi:Trk K+ transport system NAD-binding subunit